MIDASLSRGLANSIHREARDRQARIVAAVARARATPGGRRRGRNYWFNLRLTVLDTVCANEKITYVETRDGKHRTGYFAHITWFPKTEEGLAGMLSCAKLDGRRCQMDVSTLALISEHALQRLIQSCQSPDPAALATMLTPHLKAMISAKVNHGLPAQGFRLYAPNGMTAWALMDDVLPVLKTVIRAEVLEPRHQRYLRQATETGALVVPNLPTDTDD